MKAKYNIYLAGFVAAFIVAFTSYIFFTRPERPVQVAQIDLASKAPTNYPKKAYVDMHAHVACFSERNGCYINPKFLASWKLTPYLNAFGVTEQDLRNEFDEKVFFKLDRLLKTSQYIDSAVVLAMDGYYGPDGELDREKTQVLVGNHFVQSQVALRPNMYFGASINPNRKDAFEELEWAHQHAAVVVKWIPCTMGINPAENSERMKRFYSELVRLNIPLLSHAGNEHSFLRSEDELCDPARLELPLSMGVTVIAAHMSSDGKFQGEPGYKRLVRLMEKYPNLYVDNSATATLNRHKDFNLGKFFEGRVMFGTDYPLVDIELFRLPLQSRHYYPDLPWDWRQYIDEILLGHPLDQDVALKKAYDVPDDVFTRARQVLNLRK